MVRSLVVVILFFMEYPVIGQTAIPWARQIDTSYAQLAKENLELRNELNKFKEDTDRSYARIDSSIAASEHALTIFTYLLTLVSIVFGFYLAWMSKRIQTAKIDVSRSMKKAKASKFHAEMASAHAKETYGLINKDIDQIYLKLQRSEVNMVLGILLEEPLHIDVHYLVLISHKLLPVDFEPLKDALHKFIETRTAKNEGSLLNYLHILMVNFQQEAILYEKIRIALYYNVDSLMRRSPRINTSEIKEALITFSINAEDYTLEEKNAFFLFVRTHFSMDSTLLFEKLGTLDQSFKLYKMLDLTFYDGYSTTYQIDFLEQLRMHYKKEVEKLKYFKVDEFIQGKRDHLATLTI